MTDITLPPRATACTAEEHDEITAAMVGVIDRYCGMDPIDMPLARELAAARAATDARHPLASALGWVRPIDSEHSAIWQCLAGEDQAFRLFAGIAEPAGDQQRVGAFVGIRHLLARVKPGMQ